LAKVFVFLEKESNTHVFHFSGISGILDLFPRSQSFERCEFRCGFGCH
jgi:hypothetical protein